MTTEVTRLEKLRTLRNANLDAAFSVAFSTLSTGAFLVGFVQLLGGGDLWIGVLTAIPSLMGLLQIPGAIWGRSFTSFKRFVTPGGAAWRLLYVPIAFLPLLPWSNELRLTLLAAIVAVASLMMNLVNPIYNDWLAEMVPGESRGWFFSRRNAIGVGVGGVVGILGAAVLDAFRGHKADATGFFAVFVMGLVCAAVSMTFYLRMTDLPRPAPMRQNLKASLKAIGGPFGDRAFRKVLIYLVVGVFGQTMAGNLFIAFGRESLALDFRVLQGTALFMAVGNILAASLWGFLADKYGNRPVLAVAGCLVALNPIAWLLCRPGAPVFDTAILWTGHVYMGVAWAGVNLCQFNLILATAKPEDRANYIGAGMTTIAVMGGIAPLAGAALMASLRHVLPAETAYKTVFGLAGVGRFLGVLFLIPVVEVGARTFKDTFHDLRNLSPRSVHTMRTISRGGEAREAAIGQAGREGNALAADEILRALNDPVPRIRRQAAEALADLHDERATALILQRIEDEPDSVEEELVAALGRLGDPRAFPTLIAMLRSPRPMIRRAAARALGRFEDAKVAVPALIVAAEDSEDPDLRRVALQSLRRVGDPAASDALIGALDDSHPSVRIAAAEGLVEIRPEGVAPALRESLRRFPDEGASEIAYALGVLGGPEDLDLILQTAEGAGTTGRRRALLGVAHRLGTEAEAYRLMLREGMPRDQAILELLKGHRRNPTVQAALRAYSQGDDRTALQALARLDPALIPLAERPVPEAFLVAAPRLGKTSPGTPRPSGGEGQG
ncbi:hypothetical protein BH11ARM2_BH11ARM2_17230 [soil metagenome]